MEIIALLGVGVRAGHRAYAAAVGNRNRPERGGAIAPVNHRLARCPRKGCHRSGEGLALDGIEGEASLGRDDPPGTFAVLVTVADTVSWTMSTVIVKVPVPV